MVDLTLTSAELSGGLLGVAFGSGVSLGSAVLVGGAPGVAVGWPALGKSVACDAAPPGLNIINIVLVLVAMRRINISATMATIPQMICHDLPLATGDMLRAVVCTGGGIDGAASTGTAGGGVTVELSTGAAMGCAGRIVVLGYVPVAS
jgi:hypothetical protein